MAGILLVLQQVVEVGHSYEEGAVLGIVDAAAKVKRKALGFVDIDKVDHSCILGDEEEEVDEEVDDC